MKDDRGKKERSMNKLQLHFNQNKKHRYSNSKVLKPNNSNKIETSFIFQ